MLSEIGNPPSDLGIMWCGPVCVEPTAEAGFLHPIGRLFSIDLVYNLRSIGSGCEHSLFLWSRSG